jgi:hypothetical protein
VNTYTGTITKIVDCEPPHPSRSAGMETCSLDSARKYRSENMNRNAKIYRRTEKGWKLTA